MRFIRARNSGLSIKGNTMNYLLKLSLVFATLPCFACGGNSNNHSSNNADEDNVNNGDRSLTSQPLDTRSAIPNVPNKLDNSLRPPVN